MKAKIMSVSLNNDLFEIVLLCDESPNYKVGSYLDLREADKENKSDLLHAKHILRSVLSNGLTMNPDRRERILIDEIERFLKL